MTTVDVIREPKTYERGGPHGWLSDLCKRALGSDPEADDRLQSHAREIRVDQEKRTAPNLTAGTGGEFAPPEWLTSLFSGANRTPRPLADLVPWQPLKAGIQSVSIPNMIVGPAVDEITPGSPEIVADMTTSSLKAQVATISGAMSVSQQLFDLTPGAFDELMYAELLKAYDERLEYNLVNGTGINGQLNGMISVIPQLTANQVIDGSGVTTIPTFSVALGKAAANQSTNRRAAPQIIVLAGRRWFWYASAVDSSNRPIAAPNGLVIPLERQTVDQPVMSPIVGPIMGLPAYIDAAIAGDTSADNAYTARPADMLLQEGPTHVLATPESLSGTLSVRLSLHRSAAFFPLRIPNALGVVQNMPQPSGY